MELPRLLLYNIEESKKFNIEKLCKRMKIEVRNIKEVEYGFTLGYLCGLEKQQEEQKAIGNIDKEMMIISGFSDTLLDEFLKEYRDAGIAQISIKAVLTKHNQKWTSTELFKELSKEHEYFIQKNKEKNKDA